MSIAITEAITTLAEAERRFNLSRTEDEAFFSEWQTHLPDGMVTNGDDILFVKLVQRSPQHYALSRIFAPFTSSEELSSALRILKRMGQVMGERIG